MLIRHDSNRVETLAEVLAEVLREPVAHPFQPEILIVQSNGMARWLSLRLADRLGICSNIRFPFPSSFLWQTLRQTLEQALGGVPETASFDKPVLTWRILGMLSRLDDDEVFKPLQAYLRAGDDPFRAYDLARSIADVYDQYLVYRPDWIAAWEQGEAAVLLPDEQRWQPELWRRLSQGVGDHRARLLQQFAEQLQAPTPPPGLPARLSVFGVSALAPQQLQLLTLLARHCELHLFLLNPCQEYWGDIRAERDLARRADAERDPADDYLEVGNPLLASLGKQGRDIFDLLSDESVDSHEYFTLPPDQTLLAQLQTDIVQLHERGHGTGERAQPQLPLADGDDSLQVHSCHSPTRELEVLQDRLLDLFSRYPDLQPADVVVMTPDIDAYGPMIEAVFGSAEPARYIPYSIADRSPGAERPLFEAVQQLLELGRGRYPVDQVLGFLELDAVRKRFELEADDLGLIRDWLQHTGVRWGVDAADRTAFAVPATAEHTWRAGLERLLLGYALPGGGRKLWAEVLPYDPIEGRAALVMGRLQRFATGLFALRAEVVESRPLADWVVIIQTWLERFFAPAETQAEELQDVRSALERISSHAAQAGFSDPVPLTVVRSALTMALSQQASSGGFFAGGVTFATMVPMRSIPFAVVCLIGMNHGSYPRPHRPVDFDLMSTHYRKGDRSRRQDDRYLFLEALLSARRCFYLSYIGRDICDNNVIPPSVLVSELLDVVERGFTPAASDQSIRAQLCIEHPLHAFSHQYFDGEHRGLFSYSTELAELSRRASTPRRGVTPFLSQGLPSVDPAWLTVSFQQWQRFFASPVKFLLSQCLGVQLPLEQQVLSNQEPFQLDNLQSYILRQHLLEWQLAGLDLEHALGLARAQSLLPHGQVGVNVFQREWHALRPLTIRVQRLRQTGQCEPVSFDIQVAVLRLHGRLEGLSTAGLSAYRPANIKPKDRLRLWLAHLILNAVRPPGISPESRCLGLDGEVTLSPVEPDHAAELLATLGQLYQCGLTQPLPLFERSSWAYAEAIMRNQSPEAALRQADNQWAQRDGFPQGMAGESEDPWLALAFRGQPSPLDGRFMSVAQQVWQPYFQYEVKG